MNTRKFLLADEHTGSLDEMSREQFFNLLIEMAGTEA